MSKKVKNRWPRARIS